eukprot:scaffold7856_cov444-Prasinococcus_capsulatus_cf.AAC.2
MGLEPVAVCAAVVCAIPPAVSSASTASTSAAAASATTPRTSASLRCGASTWPVCGRDCAAHVLVRGLSAAKMGHAGAAVQVSGWSSTLHRRRGRRWSARSSDPAAR